MAATLAKTVLDLLFPPLCIDCRAPVSEPGFCAACWSGITFLDDPGCACCGLPFPVMLEGENLCATCLAKPPAFDTARAILAYDEHSRGGWPGNGIGLTPQRWPAACPPPSQGAMA